MQMAWRWIDARPSATTMLTNATWIIRTKRKCCHFDEIIVAAWNGQRYFHQHYNDVIMSAMASHQRRVCILNRLTRRRSKKTSKLRVTGLCEGNSPATGEFPAKRASNAENVSISWRHHEMTKISVHIMLIPPQPRFVYRQPVGSFSIGRFVPSQL